MPLSDHGITENDRIRSTERVIASSEALSTSAEKSPGLPDGGFMAWLQVGGAFCIFFSTWGVINMYGVYQTYYETSFLSYESESNISWIGSLQGFLLNVISIITGPIYDAGYLRVLIVAGTFLAVLGMMLTSICTTYWQVVLAQGLMVGIGDGMLFLPSIAIISQYFSNRKSLATGIASLGSSIGGVVFPVVFRQLQPRIGFAWTTRVIAFIMLGASVVSLASMRQRMAPPTRRKLFDWGAFTEMPYLFFLVGTFFGFMGIFVPFFYVQLNAIQVAHTSPNLAFYLLSILNAGSIFGRTIPNFLADIIGPFNMQIFCISVTALLAFCWIAITDTAGVVVFTAVYGFFFGPFVSLSPPIVMTLTSDLSKLGTRMGMFLGVSGLGILVGNPVAGAILRSQGSWAGLQAWSGAAVIVAAAFMLAGRLFKSGPHLWVKA